MKNLSQVWLPSKLKAAPSGAVIHKYILKALICLNGNPAHIYNTWQPPQHLFQCQQAYLILFLDEYRRSVCLASLLCELPAEVIRLPVPLHISEDLLIQKSLAFLCCHHHPFLWCLAAPRPKATHLCTDGLLIPDQLNSCYDSHSTSFK